MKNILFIACFLLGFTALNAQADKVIPFKDVPTIMDETIGGPIMTFENPVVDYGEIAQHSEPLRVLNFSNTGTEPLVIKSARGSCGCTVPIWPKEPIMPGESSEIEIRYDTKRLGKFSKTVTITTNEISEPKVVKVTGMVNKSEESESVPSAPTNIMQAKPGGKN